MFGLKRIARERDTERRSQYLQRLTEVLSDRPGDGTRETASDSPAGLEVDQNLESDAGLTAPREGTAALPENLDPSTFPAGAGLAEPSEPYMSPVCQGFVNDAPPADGIRPDPSAERRALLAVVTAAPSFPEEIRVVQGRIAEWRRSRPGQTPLPEALWAAAVDLARRHGVVRTAKALGLDCRKLKRLAASPPTPAPAQTEQAQPAASECIIEVEGPRGKMRVQWRGNTMPDLAGLSRALLKPE